MNALPAGSYEVRRSEPPSWASLKRNNVTVLGDADRCILFLHGMGTDQRMWREIVPAFSQYRRILFDHRGFGKSDVSQFSTARYARLEDYVIDILEVVRALEVRHITAVGHSLGGAMALAAAAAEPSLFDAVVTLNASACYLNSGSYQGGLEKSDFEQIASMIDINRETWAREFVNSVTGSTTPTKVIDELVQSFSSVPASIMRNFVRIVAAVDMRSELANIGVRTLVIQGHADPFVPQSAAQFLASTLPNAIYRQLDFVGHFPTLTHPSVIIRAIDDFMREVG